MARIPVLDLPLTSGSRVLMSLILLPLKFKCVRLGVLSASTSRPPEIRLSLSSSCQEKYYEARL